MNKQNTINDIKTYSDYIKKLIILGKQIRAGKSSVEKLQLEPLRRISKINRYGKDFVAEVTLNMETEDVASFIVGLAYVETEFQWVGGSGATTIWLYKILQSRDGSLADLIGDWILQNSTNPYLPFGSQRNGAGTVSDFREITRKRKAEISSYLEVEKEFEAQAKQERQRRKQQKAHSFEHRNSAERDRLIDELNIMSHHEQLQRIANDTYHSVNFYPTRIADSTTIEILEQLSPEVCIALACKLKGKQRGPWGAFKKRLLSVQGLPWPEKERWRLTIDLNRK